MITFSQTQIDTFSPEEREIFNQLVAKAKATIEPDEKGLDVKSIIERHNALEKENETYSAKLESDFC